MHALEIRNLSHWYGKQRILNKVNLDIAPGQIVALVGPSGCGKSTLLRAILGTDPPSEGQVLAEGRVVTEPSRDVGIVYQNYSLYEFLSAEENVAFGLKLDKTSLTSRFTALPAYLRKRREHLQMARDFLKRVGLEAAMGQYPSQLRRDEATCCDCPSVHSKAQNSTIG